MIADSVRVGRYMVASEVPVVTQHGKHSELHVPAGVRAHMFLLTQAQICSHGLPSIHRHVHMISLIHATTNLPRRHVEALGSIRQRQQQPRLG